MKRRFHQAKRESLLKQYEMHLRIYERLGSAYLLCLGEGERVVLEAQREQLEVKLERLGKQIQDLEKKASGVDSSTIRQLTSIVSAGNVEEAISKYDKALSEQGYIVYEKADETFTLSKRGNPMLGFVILVSVVFVVVLWYLFSEGILSFNYKEKPPVIKRFNLDRLNSYCKSSMSNLKVVGKNCFFVGKAVDLLYGFKDAVDFYKKSCQARNGAGCNNYGCFLFMIGEKLKAQKKFKLSCRRYNDETGCYNLGLMYHKGIPTGRDLKKALKFYKQSCDMGEPLGCTYKKALSQKQEQ